MNIRLVLMWGAILWIAYTFIYAGLPKIFDYGTMIERMQVRGFGREWSLFIGICEVLGGIAILIPPLRSTALILLFPLAIGALTVHLAAGEPMLRYYKALSISVLIPIALLLDPYFKIILYKENKIHRTKT